jgi:ABC-type amino acid transport substrate-binding protein
MHDSPVAAYYATLSPDKFEVALPSLDSAPEGVVVAKNNPDMLKAIQQAVDAMKSDGTLDAIKAKWGAK